MRNLPIIVAFFLSIITYPLLAQSNLLPNGSFEEIIADTSVIISFQDSSGWSNVARLDTLDKSDKLLQVTAKNWNPNELKIPINCIYQSKIPYSHSGTNFALITPYDQTKDEGVFVRNLVGQFCKPLAKGHIYTISFYLKAFCGNAFSHSLEVAISNFKYPVSYYFNSNALVKSQPEIYPSACFTITDFLDKKEYHNITFQYIAKGDEQYIYIGNFHIGYMNKNQVTATPQFGFYKNKDAPVEIVYALDDISLISEDSSENCLPASVSRDSIVSASDTTKLGDVYFDFNISDFSKDLNSVIEQLKKARDYKQIIVIGYTDSKGSLEYNLQLSRLRAKYVLNAFKTITPKEILIDAKGESVRKSTDALERRVEVRIVK